jgi:hypothetical protein
MSTRWKGAFLLPLLLISSLSPSLSLADRHSNRDYDNRSYDNRDDGNDARELDRPERHAAPTQGEHGRSTYDRNEGRAYNNRSERHSRPDYDDDRDVSINFIVGPSTRAYSQRTRPQPRTYYPSSAYNNFSYNSFSYGSGYSISSQYYLNNAYPYSTFDYKNQRPQVIIERNTYIEQPTRRANVITYRNRPDTSLLRDLNGRCFERYIDSNGYETRTELPASACNF